MTFRLKLAIFTIVIQIGLFSTFSFLSLSHSLKKALQEAEQLLEKEAELLEAVVVGEWVPSDQKGLEEAARRLTESANVGSVTVIGHDGSQILHYGQRADASGSMKRFLATQNRVHPLAYFLGSPPPVTSAHRDIRVGSLVLGRIVVRPDLSSIELQLKELAQLHLWAGLFGCGVIALVSWASGALVGRRIVQLTKGAQRIAEGDLQFRLEPKGKDEVAEIGRAIDALADSLIEGRREVERQARHDALTGCLNREGLNSAMDECNALSWPMTVLHLDLDRFKLVNDTRGLEAGDAVLCEVAQRMQNGVPEARAIARVGGDEFIVLLERPVEDPLTRQVAERLISLVSEPVLFEGSLLRVGASVGLAGVPVGPHTRNILRRLLTDADIALFQAKTGDRGGVAVFDSAARAAREAEADLEMEIAEALMQSAFVPFIQPQVDSETGAVVGAEVLARWEHPMRGTLTPFHFFNGLRNADLADAIDAQVRAKALQWLAEANGLRPEAISLNVTARQLTRVNGAELFAREVERAGIRPEQVVVEVHENVILETESAVLDNLNELVTRGHRLELDDFGTGNSSLQNLMRIPVDTLKIDRSFVTDIGNEPERRAIVGAVIGVSKALGVRILAEGVETEEEAEVLRELGCRNIQGYLVARPMPLDAFEDWNALHKSVWQARKAG